MKTVQREKRVVLKHSFDTNSITAVNTVGESPNVSMENYQHVTFHVITNAVGDDMVVSLEQSTTFTTTGTKAVAFDTIYRAAHLDGTATNRDKFSPVAVSGNAHTLTSSDATCQYLIEVDSSSLDRDNGFKCVRVVFDDPGATTIVTTVAEMKEANFAGQEDSTGIFPSALG